MNSLSRFLRSEITQTATGLVIALLLVRYWHFLPTGVTAPILILAGGLFIAGISASFRRAT